MFESLIESVIYVHGELILKKSEKCKAHDPTEQE